MFVHKTVKITGNLNSNGKLSYRLCPNTGFSNGRWCLGISSLCFESNLNILNLFCTAATNFCVAQQFSQADIQTYEEPLATFHVNLSKAYPKTVISFANPILLEINRISGKTQY